MPSTRAMRDRQEVRQLPGAAADLDHAGVVRNLLVQQPREETGPRLLEQRALVVEVVVVGERRLLVELLDDVGDVVGRRLARIGRHEEPGNAFLDRIASRRSRD